jgi:hypothetical protein
MSKRFLSGDIAGGIQDIERLSRKEGELVRPIGGNRNIGEGLQDDGFITKEIHDGGAVGRALNKGKVLDVDIINHTMGSEHETAETHFTTKEIWPDPIQRNLYKGELLDEDVVNSTLGKGNRIDGKTAWTGETTEVYLRNKELYKDPTQRNIEGTPTQVEIWKDPFQRNIDSNITSELPGYIKNRTKFLNEINTKQSIRNNI